jgi:cell division protein FtsB
MGERQEKRGSFWVKLILLFGFVSAGLIIFSASREVQRKSEVEKEIESLKEEARKIQRENLDLESKISYLESRDYQEKEAKDKLNLKSPGESLVVIKPGLAQSGQEEEAKTEASTPQIEKRSNIPNPIKWWNYFFKY